MDTTIRNLQRRAAIGDIEAANKLARMDDEPRITAEMLASIMWQQSYFGLQSFTEVSDGGGLHGVVRGNKPRVTVTKFCKNCGDHLRDGTCLSFRAPRDPYCTKSTEMMALKLKHVRRHV